MVPSVVLEKRERMVQLKATKEEYIKNLREMANESESHRRRLNEEEAEEEFETLAAVESNENEQFSEIIKTTNVADT
jgi:hypothetical protein